MERPVDFVVSAYVYSDETELIFLHPVNHLVMSELENELVDDTIDADSPTGQFELGVGRVIEDEVVLVKVGELCTTNATGHLD